MNHRLKFSLFLQKTLGRLCWSGKKFVKNAQKIFYMKSHISLKPIYTSIEKNFERILLLCSRFYLCLSVCLSYVKLFSQNWPRVKTYKKKQMFWGDLCCIFRLFRGSLRFMALLSSSPVVLFFRTDCTSGIILHCLS